MSPDASDNVITVGAAKQGDLDRVGDMDTTVPENRLDYSHWPPGSPDSDDSAPTAQDVSPSLPSTNGVRTLFRHPVVTTNPPGLTLGLGLGMGIAKINVGGMSCRSIGVHPYKAGRPAHCHLQVQEDLFIVKQSATFQSCNLPQAYR